jgi:hypothetical protein
VIGGEARERPAISWVGVLGGAGMVRLAVAILSRQTKSVTKCSWDLRVLGEPSEASALKGGTFSLLCTPSTTTVVESLRRLGDGSGVGSWRLPFTLPLRGALGDSGW